MNNKTLTTASILAIATIIVTMICVLRLPATVITQFSINGGNVTTMSKPIAIAIPVFICLLGIYFCGSGKDYMKSILISAVGIAVMVVMLIVNS